MNEVIIHKQIQDIDERLDVLRQDWVTATPNKKRFIEDLAKLLKEKRARLVVRMEQ